MTCFQGYWQCPLANEAHEYFTFVTGDGLFTWTRVPQGVMNATSYFQGMMMEVLVNLVRRGRPSDTTQGACVDWMRCADQRRWAS